MFTVVMTFLGMFSVVVIAAVIALVLLSVSVSKFKRDVTDCLEEDNE